MNEPFRWNLQFESQNAVSSLNKYKDMKLYGTYQQDMAPILARTNMLRNGEEWTQPGSEFWHLADIPVSLVHKWKQEGFDLMAMPAKAGPEQQEFLRELRKRIEVNDMQQLIVCGKRW